MAYKQIKYNGKKYRISGYSTGALKMAYADYELPKRLHSKLGRWAEVKNYSIRRRLAIIAGK